MKNITDNTFLLRDRLDGVGVEAGLGGGWARIVTGWCGGRTGICGWSMGRVVGLVNRLTDRRNNMTFRILRNAVGNKNVR